jgi:transcriptional regulator with XRE-family HTH domain
MELPGRRFAVDVCLLIRQRLDELGLEQRDLAAAAKVTESYISQLLTRKKAPPAPERTDIYERMGKFLKLPAGKLAKLADSQRMEELKRNLGDSPAPLFKETRALILGKCRPEKRDEVRAIFERQPFGELERLVTQKLLDVVKEVAREELENENWLHLVARLTGRSYEQTRVNILEFLDADLFNVSDENCVSFLEPLIDCWDIDLATFGMEPSRPDVEPGFREFLKDPSMSGDAAPNEIEFLKQLRIKGKRPTPLYYYRELQNLRDPLHFRAAGAK